MSSILKRLQARKAAAAKPKKTEDVKPKGKPAISESQFDLMSLLDDNDSTDLESNEPVEYKSSLDLKALNARISKANYVGELDITDGAALREQINSAIQLGISQATKVIHSSVQEDVAAFYESKAGDRDAASRNLLDVDSDASESSDLFGALTKLTKKQLRKKFPDATTAEINGAAAELVKAQKDSLDLKDPEEEAPKEDEITSNDTYLDLLGAEFLPPEDLEGDDNANISGGSED